MKNNNGASIRRLSGRSLKNNRMRNFFAVLAIALTGMLFTAVFSLGSGMLQIAQEETMREVGGKFHAGLKGVTQEQYEKITADPLIKKSAYNIFIGCAENVQKRQTELRFFPEETDLSDYFIRLEEGRLPLEENEIVADTIVLNELKVPPALGEKITLTFSFMGKQMEKEFVISGWYKGDQIGHASELLVSETYWRELKGSYTDQDFKTWGQEHPEDAGVGLLAGQLYFEKTSDLEEKVRTVIANAGYEPETEIGYGVNWAYMSSRLEAVDPLTLVMLAGAVAVILLTGYLIIYNIFQISVMTEIRFYGLLKTIGTTKKQIRRLVRRQAVILSLAGIPAGLLIGYGIGKLSLPFALSFMDYKNMEISLKFHPMILVFGAVFSGLTVFLSCRRPERIAGSVSPVEAVKYTEADTGKKESKRRAGGSRKFSLVSMAFANLGRNKKKTAVVVAAISLSVILLTLVMTGVGSFRMERYLEQRIAGDFMLSTINVTANGKSGDFELDQAFLQQADAQEGILEKNELWVGFGKTILLDEKGTERYRKLDQEGKLEHSDFTEYHLQEKLSGSGSIDGYIYGYSDSLLKNLKVVDGVLDIEKFQSGDYILLGTMLGNNSITQDDRIYDPGDKITVSSITEASIPHEVRDGSGEIIDIQYENQEEKEYEVMAVVEFPYSMNLQRFASNAFDAVLPLKELTEDEGWSECFAVSYRVEEEKQEAFEQEVKTYTENVNREMSYLSQASLQQEFDGMLRVVSSLGLTLAGVIALIGILNFINAVITGIIVRKREFAMLQSIGMTEAQLRKMLVYEGISYVGIAGIISLCLGSLLSWKILEALNHVILFFEYRFQILPFLIIIPLLLAVAVAAPLAAFQRLKKKSIVERLREME